MNWPPRYSGAELVEEDHRDVLVDGQAVVLERHEIVRVGGPGPRLDRRLVGPGRRGEFDGRETGRAGLAEAGEEAEFDAEVDEPRAVEAAKAGDQVVESVVESHRRSIVPCWNAAMGGGRVP